eukprot:jgi/Tetstr1/453075/TSEL_040110.t1
MLSRPAAAAGEQWAGGEGGGGGSSASTGTDAKNDKDRKARERKKREEAHLMLPNHYLHATSREAELARVMGSYWRERASASMNPRGVSTLSSATDPPSPSTTASHCRTPAQLAFLEPELARFLTCGAWKYGLRRDFVSRDFLVPKPGGKWRVIMALRHLNSCCVRKRI